MNLRPLVRVSFFVGVSAAVGLVSATGTGCSNPAEDLADIVSDAGANFPKPPKGTSSSGGSSSGSTSSSSGGSSSGSTSSSSSSSSGSSGTPDAGSSSGSSGMPDAGSSSGSSGGNPLCPSPAPATDAPFKPAAAQQTVCNAADLTFISQQAMNPNLTFAQLETALKARNAACGACVFTKETDASWGPLVYVGNAGDGFVNWSACLTYAAGGSAACGAKLHQAESCFAEVCSVDACGSEAAADACVQTAFQNQAGCGRYDYVTACGGEANLDTLFNVCGTYLDVIAKSCGGI